LKTNLPPGFSDPIREEHHSELAADDIELGIGEWQLESVGLLPRDAPVVSLQPRGVFQHWLIEIGHHIMCGRAETRCQRA